LDRKVDKEKEQRVNAVNEGKTVTDNDLEKFDRRNEQTEEEVAKRGRKSLTTKNFRDTLQRIICARDNLNNGMGRKEVIQMIADYHGVDNKTAENHYDYCISHKMLPDLKGGGKTQTAQPTTTNRTATTTEKLLRNHTIWQMALDQVTLLNNESSDNTEEEFDKDVWDYFSLNLDESNFMASEGSVRIVGDKLNRKHQRNNNDSRDSVTAVRIGSAAGTEGPRIFLRVESTFERKQWESSGSITSLPKDRTFV